jgi:hypothetical protein
MRKDIDALVEQQAELANKLEELQAQENKYNY